MSVLRRVLVIVVLRLLLPKLLQTLHGHAQLHVGLARRLVRVAVDELRLCEEIVELELELLGLDASEEQRLGFGRGTIRILAAPNARRRLLLAAARLCVLCARHSDLMFPSLPSASFPRQTRFVATCGVAYVGARGWRESTMRRMG